MDIVKSQKYRQFFMGTSPETLRGLKENLIKLDPAINDMTFYDLPYRKVDEFDYQAIARMVEEDGAQIIWVALGAPKQEYFMNRLKPYLKGGVMIAVGAAFKFFSGTDEKRAPGWMIKCHLEFIYRIFADPKKQMGRCKGIIVTMPRMLANERKRKKEKALKG